MTNRELDMSKARGSIQQWVIGDGYVIEADHLMQVGNIDKFRLYYPFAFPEIVTEFAKLNRGDEEAVLSFAREWGLIGPQYSQEAAEAVSTDAPSYMYGFRKPYGDPLDWIWDHAEQARLVLSLIHLLRLGDNNTSQLGQFLIDLERQMGKPMYSSDVKSFSPKQPPIRAWIGDRPISDYNASQFPDPHVTQQSGFTVEQEYAYDLVKGIVNPNLREVTTTLTSDFRRGPTRSMAFGCLIDVIYAQLADAAVGDKPYRRCEFCSDFFEQTHGRQRFCPPKHDEKESLCALRSRKKAFRERQKK